MNYIAVSSNCQTAGLVDCLKAIFPNDQITPLPLPWPFHPDKHAAPLALQLTGYDFWVTIANKEVCDRVLAKVPERQPGLIRIPAIGFPAFPPDLCYAQNSATQTLTQYHYNSAIASWCYRNRVEPKDTESLFCAEIYAALGYFDQWGAGRDYLSKSFKIAGLEADFESFFLNLQRTGCFMHTINHPKIYVLELLSKIVAKRMGLPPVALNRPLAVQDALADTVWPLYPEVADAFSLQGGNTVWQLNPAHLIDGVRDYVAFSFDSYAAQGIAPDKLQILHRDEALLNRVLGNYLGVK